MRAERKRMRRQIKRKWNVFASPMVEGRSPSDLQKKNTTKGKAKGERRGRRQKKRKTSEKETEKGVQAREARREEGKSKRAPLEWGEPRWEAEGERNAELRWRSE